MTHGRARDLGKPTGGDSPIANPSTWPAHAEAHNRGFALRPRQLPTAARDEANALRGYAKDALAIEMPVPLPGPNTLQPPFGPNAVRIEKCGLIVADNRQRGIPGSSGHGNPPIRQYGQERGGTPAQPSDHHRESSGCILPYCSQARRAVHVDGSEQPGHLGPAPWTAKDIRHPDDIAVMGLRIAAEGMDGPVE